MCIGLHVKCLLFLSDFNELLIFSTEFQKKKILKMSNFMKIRPVGAELFRMARQTDMTKLVVAFCNFVITPEKGENKS